MADDLNKSQLRAFQYFYVDGSFELAIGLLCLLLAIYFYLDVHLQTWLSAILEASFVLVLIVGAIIVNLVIKRLKERLTWPRTGYISYQRKSGRQRSRGLVVGMVAGGVVAALFTILVMKIDFHIAVMPLLSGLLFGLVLVIMGWRTSIWRFYVLAFLSVVLGVALAYSGLDNNAGLIAYYTSISIVLIVTGVCVLGIFLRRNPIQRDTSDGQ